ncbi:calmodulin-binding transcription activator 5-like isoform X2 [Abrus precatorius]|uniref:Calmodulin-binding transcription activator 5-like isoform X2 n=2 Tax=Abrus precatorius TaxID=3816 RepID=A0A8B8K7P0_ABRPR|nr:calmodulin-binding transcription activator 5-like isoform X2 [Abrus precatorius]XP_027339148.1 calmodulin-binding transcription activator 5-like isoform X2 [Abrus precatorius]
MAHKLTGQLVGSEIHGFHTLRDLDVGNTMEEAKGRWLRPNEIHAILCNHKYFTINAKPVNLPPSGTIVLFDRKMLRNFRKDGHNWKKKSDGKTVKEAHEHLKVGNEERIHVYYAHGQDNPSFVRRCYWLLDKSLEHIVLVHYRETQELQGSPVTPVNSNSSSVSDPTAPWIPSEDLDSGTNSAYVGLNDNLTVKSHEQRLHELNTLEWDDLVVSNVNSSTTPNGGNVPCLYQQNQSLLNGSFGNVPSNLSAEVHSYGNLTLPISGSNSVAYSFQEDINLPKNVPISADGVESVDTVGTLVNEGLQSQDSFRMWMNVISDTPCSLDESPLESSISSIQEPYSSLVADNLQSSLPEQVFNLTEVSPTWASSTEKTKVLVTGFFHSNYQHLAKSNLLCVCGDVSVPVEIVQVGVYRCWVSPHSPGLVNLYLSFDAHKPISQVVNFEYRTPMLHDPTASMEEKHNWNEFRLQMRLAHLLFATEKTLNIFSSKVSLNALKEAKKFSSKTSFISRNWQYLMKSIDNNTTPFPQAKDTLFEISLKNKLKEWLLERIVLGCKTTEYDAQGQGVIHLCAMLGYTWAISLFSWSGLSLDFRDKFGWTALHWAAYFGSEKMVATLLSCGARPNLITDPTPQNPAGCTVADLAYTKGHDGLAAYLSEKSLVEQFNDMSLAGNISGTLETSSTDAVNPENLTEDQLYLKETLAAYRTAAEAAGRIQAAFRERSLKLQSKAVEFCSPEDEARQIVAAMKIQHAFRNFETKKMMAAAARIQHTFRTWKYRREYLHMRRQAIKIQAAFRGFQARKQYCKIIWSVGVLEKAILRWRLKRKGFRGLQVNAAQEMEDEKQESCVEEDFFRASRKQAEERVERSVVRVQAMFRSKKAQEEYRRMKLAHNQAKLELELEEFLNSEVDILTPRTTFPKDGSY